MSKEKKIGKGVKREERADAQHQGDKAHNRMRSIRDRNTAIVEERE